MANRAKGKVSRLYPNPNGTYIRLDYAGIKPKDGYFWLPKTSENYNSFYSLAMVAAVNNYDLLIRTREEIIPDKHSNVVYMVVDW